MKEKLSKAQKEKTVISTGSCGTVKLFQQRKNVASTLTQH